MLYMQLTAAAIPGPQDQQVPPVHRVLRVQMAPQVRRAYRVWQALTEPPALQDLRDQAEALLVLQAQQVLQELPDQVVVLQVQPGLQAQQDLQVRVAELPGRQVQQVPRAYRV